MIITHVTTNLWLFIVKNLIFIFFYFFNSIGTRKLFHASYQHWSELKWKKPPETQATGQHQARGKQVDAPTPGNFHFYPRTCKKKKKISENPDRIFPNSMKNRGWLLQRIVVTMLWQCWNQAIRLWTLCCVDENSLV